MAKLPAPIATPRELPGTPHAPDTSPDEARALCAVRAGDQFRWRGRHYLATADASPVSRGEAWAGVFIEACRTNPAMPSGWELADISASWKRQPRPLLPRKLRRLLQVNYREAHAGRGYGKGAHGRINERAHIRELLGDRVESGRVAIAWHGTSYCDAPGGAPMQSESIIRVPPLAKPDEFWRLIDRTDPWIEGPASWNARRPSEAGRYACEVESGK